MTLTLVVVALLAATIGAALGYMLRAARAARTEAELRIVAEVARAQIANGAGLVAEREAALALAQERLKASFDSLATQSLKSNNELFLGLARESLGQQQVEARASREAREKAIETQV